MGGKVVFEPRITHLPSATQRARLSLTLPIYPLQIDLHTDYPKRPKNCFAPLRGAVSVGQISQTEVVKRGHDPKQAEGCL